MKLVFATYNLQTLCAEYTRLVSDGKGLYRVTSLDIDGIREYSIWQVNPVVG